MSELFLLQLNILKWLTFTIILPIFIMKVTISTIIISPILASTIIKVTVMLLVVMTQLHVSGQSRLESLAGGRPIVVIQ